MRRFFIAFIILLGIYFAWSFNGRSVKFTGSYMPISDLQMMNAPAGRSNVVSLQPRMTTLDYSGAGAFYQKMDFYFTEMKKSGVLRGTSVVLLPEHIGTWLVAAEEKSSIYEAGTIEDAIRLAAISNVFQFIYYYFQTESENKLQETTFRMKANKMAMIYEYAFSRIAQKFEIHIVAGSIVLPEPVIIDGKISLSDGPLRHVSMVFKPDGSIDQQLTFKKYPGPAERAFLEPSKEDIPVLDLPIGKSRILIGEDGMHPEHYEDSTIYTLNPSFLSATEKWDSAWHGLDPLPSDVKKEDIGTITRAEAWHRYASGRSKSTAITLFFRGELWDIGAEGRSFIKTANQLREGIESDNPVILNTWFY